jgi:hypothetical protein
LSSCTVDYERGRGRRILAVDGLGNVLNEYGEVVAQSKIEHSGMIYSVEKGNMIIVTDDLGTIYQIKPTYL